MNIDLERITEAVRLTLHDMMLKYHEDKGYIPRKNITKEELCYLVGAIKTFINIIEKDTTLAYILKADTLLLTLIVEAMRICYGKQEELGNRINAEVEDINNVLVECEKITNKNED